MAGRLSGKVAVVTGIGAGIGQGCALAFAREGATVVGCDINPQTANATATQATVDGHAIECTAPLDLTDPNAVAGFFAAVGARHGRIDVLLNAAAIAPRMAKVAEMDYRTQWSATMTGEADIVFLACREAWAWLKASPAASIINFASVNAFRGSSNFGMAAHCAGKAAVLGFTRQLAVESGPTIRANTISPGLVVTAATESASATSGATREAILARVPLKRLGTAQDIAWCAIYLASDESAWVTGANFPVDGGVMCN